MLLNELRIETALPIARYGHLHLAVVSQHLLAAVAVAMVAAGLFFIRIEMMVHLSVENPLCQRFLQILDQISALEGGQRVFPAEQLIQQLVCDRRLFAFACHCVLLWTC